MICAMTYFSVNVLSFDTTNEIICDAIGINSLTASALSTNTGAVMPL